MQTLGPVTARMVFVFGIKGLILIFLFKAQSYHRAAPCVRFAAVCASTYQLVPQRGSTVVDTSIRDPDPLALALALGLAPGTGTGTGTGSTDTGTGTGTCHGVP